MMPITETVKHLLIINVILFIASSFVPEVQAYLPMYFFESELFKFWQPLTHMFMHGSLMHLLFNMFGLYMFGSILERLWGGRKFLFFYISCGLGAALLHQGVSYYQIHSILNQVSHLNISSDDLYTILNADMKSGNSFRGDLLYQSAQTVFDKINMTSEDFGLLFRAAAEYQTMALGASGAIYGILVAFGFMFPNEKLMLMFLPIGIKAKFFIPILLTYDFLSGLNGSSVFGFGGGVAHFAHIGGAVTGFLIMWYWKKNSFNHKRWN